MLTHLVNWDDAGMIKLRRRFGLAAKTRQVHWRGGIPDAYHFQGDNSIQGKLMGLVNDPHSSTPDLLQNLVIAKNDSRGAAQARVGRRAAISLYVLATKPKGQQALWALSERYVARDFPTAGRAFRRFGHAFIGSLIVQQPFCSRVTDHLGHGHYRVPDKDNSIASGPANAFNSVPRRVAGFLRQSRPG